MATGVIRHRSGAGAAAPVLDLDDPPARRLAELTGRDHPVRGFVVGVLLAYVAIAGLSTLLGLLVTHVILSSHAVASDDESFVRFLVRHRSSDLTEASLIGSIIAGGVVLPAIAAVTGAAAALVRQWRIAAFLATGLLIESASYRTTTLLVPRHRPEVARLESLPVNASYPSGHTAASIVVYGGIALLLSSRISSLWARVPIWAVAVSIPAYVALSRMYRGMHHPLDVAGGAVIGVATLLAIVWIARAAGIAASRRTGADS